MNNEDEVKELLREIRDLQKAHFERYKQFTQSIMENNTRLSEESKSDLWKAQRLFARSLWVGNITTIALLILIFCLFAASRR